MTTTQTSTQVQQWTELAQQLRVDSIRCTTAAGSGRCIKINLPTIASNS